MSWHKRRPPRDPPPGDAPPSDAPNDPASGEPGKRGYHHGNLREALIKAAINLISAKGPSGFTFAEAARAAGVSAAAPYRHYRDRDALMADIAARGFQRFAQELKAAWDDGRPAPRQAFDRVGRAYLAFARNEPALYAAMFESGLDLSEHAELHAAGDRAFGVLRHACEALVATLPAANRPPALMMALHVWSLAHGTAALFARGDGGRRVTPISAEELLESAMLLYMHGLGFDRA